MIFQATPSQSMSSTHLQILLQYDIVLEITIEHNYYVNTIYFSHAITCLLSPINNERRTMLYTSE